MATAHYFEWLTISGHKYVTGSTALIQGFTFKLYQGSSSTEYATAVSDVNGLYSFLVKDPGTYKINEVLPTGWTFTDPAAAYTVGPASGSAEVTGYSSITVASGTNINGKDFKNFQWLTVSGTKKDTSNAGLAGWTIKLYKDSFFYAWGQLPLSSGSYSIIVKATRHIRYKGGSETSLDSYYADVSGRRRRNQPDGGPRLQFHRCERSESS